MFRIILLLCYSLIDTNTIPFYFSLSQIGRVESHTQRFGLTVSFRRFPPHSTSPIPQGTFSTFGLTLSHGQNSLKPQLLQVVIRTQHGVFAGLKRFGWTFWESAAFHQQAYKFDVMRLWDSKGSVNLLRINCVLPTSSHTQRFAVTVSFRRKLLTLRQLSHGRSIYFYYATS